MNSEPLFEISQVSNILLQFLEKNIMQDVNPPFQKKSYAKLRIATDEIFETLAF